VPYRNAAAPDARSRPHTVVYVPAFQKRVSGVAALQMVGLPPVVGALLALLHPNAGLVGLVGTVVALLWWWKRPPVPAAILSIEEGDLVVRRSGDRARASIRWPLRDVRDVVLETKSIQPIGDGGSPIPGVRTLDPSIGPEIETARIVLVGPQRRVRLTEEYFAHMDSSEWLGKIRVMLRKHGWVPEDERDGGPEAEGAGPKRRRRRHRG
jgi:hypothetical protein